MTAIKKNISYICCLIALTVITTLGVIVNIL